MLRALIVLALAGALVGCGRAHLNVRPVVDPRSGIQFDLPRGWRWYDDPQNGQGATMLATYPVGKLADITETPPKGATWLLLFDYGPLWTVPGWDKEFEPLPNRLPTETGIEGFGSGRNLGFQADGHGFQAFIKGNPRSATTLGILRSLRHTAFGRSLALVITKRTIEGVQIWQVGNPRSRRKLIVVGCPGLANGCSGFAVTNRLVSGPAPLATDLYVIERLRGHEDVLARLQRRLHPEATIRLGRVRDADASMRRIVALAR